MSAELQVIKGKIENLVVQRGEEIIVGSDLLRGAGTGAAVGLAAAGLAGAATSALLASGGIADSVEFFSSKVNGKSIAGRFSRVTFKEGDDVEVVGEAQPDGTVAALAVRRPADQTLWIFPHCSRGGRAQKKLALRVFGWTFLAFALICSIGVWQSSKGTDDLADSVQFFGAISLVMSLTGAAYFSFRTATQWRPFVRKAESIFASLGYGDPRGVDMEKQNKRYWKANGGKWPYLTDGPWIYRYLDRT